MRKAHKPGDHRVCQPERENVTCSDARGSNSVVYLPIASKFPLGGESREATTILPTTRFSVNPIAPELHPIYLRFLRTKRGELSLPGRPPLAIPALEYTHASAPPQVFAHPYSCPPRCSQILVKTLFNRGRTFLARKGHQGSLFCKRRPAPPCKGTPAGVCVTRLHHSPSISCASRMEC